MTGREFIQPLKGVRRAADGWVAICPAHDDRKASLSVKDSDELLIHCFAGCSFESIMAKIPRASENGRRQSVAEYSYHDENGKLLCQCVRYAPKDFRQRRPDGRGGWEWKLDGTRRVLYGLPELLNANPLRTVVITEGEKDADRLRALGIIATTNLGGAGKWRPQYNEALRGRKVCILPDNDVPGRAHARQIARSLHGIAASVKLIELPGLPEKGDVSDWLDAGNGKIELRQLVRAAPEFEPERTSAPLFSTYREFMSQTVSDAEVIALEACRGELVLVQSVTNRGKSTLMMNTALCLAAEREFLSLVPAPIARRVIYLQFEGSRGRFQNDLRVMERMFDEQEKNRLERNFFPAHAPEIDDEPLSFPRHLNLFELEARAIEPDLVVIDTASAAFSIRKESDNSEVTALMKSLVRMARRLRCVIVVIHHIGKANLEDGQTKEAAHRGRGASSWADNASAIFNLECNPATPDFVMLICAKRKTGTGEGYETRIKLDRAARWFFPTNDSPPRPLTNREMVLRVLTDSPLPTAGIVQLLAGKASERTVRNCLNELLQDGLVSHPKHGHWQRQNGANGKTATPLRELPNCRLVDPSLQTLQNNELLAAMNRQKGDQVLDDLPNQNQDVFDPDEGLWAAAPTGNDEPEQLIEIELEI